MPMVMQAVYNGSREFVNVQSTSTDLLSKREKLGRTQSMLLYQIIRLFDGDIMLRAQAQKDIPLLLAWIDDLCTIRDHGGYDLQPGLYTGEKEAPRWKVRRSDELLVMS
jgi:hypothetical protein